MSRDRRFFLWLSSLLLLLIFSAWYWGGRSSSLYRLDAQMLAHSIDFAATDVRFDEFNEEGQLSRHLEAVLLQHIPFENQFFLEAPYITFQQANAQWQMTARHAKSTHGFEQVHFQDRVILTQEAVNTQPASTLYTSELTYFPKQERMFTDQLVLFKQEPHSLTAGGMQADLKHNQVQLMRNAHFWGRLKPGDPMVHAYSQAMAYFPQQQLLVLTDHARITQGKNEFSAPVIHYHVNTHQIDTAPVKTDKIKPDKTKFVFYLDKKHEHALSTTFKKKL